MLAIDTNVLIRYLTNDSPDQSRSAQRLIDEEASRADPLLVGGEVLAETYWYLAKSRKLPRDTIAAILWALLDNAHLAVPDRTAVTAAVDAYQQGPAGFVDYLIAARARSHGADYTFTFDRDAAKHASFRLLSSGD